MVPEGQQGHPIGPTTAPAGRTTRRPGSNPRTDRGLSPFHGAGKGSKLKEPNIVILKRALAPERRGKGALSQQVLAMRRAKGTLS
jgi:hypothetical protein